MQRRECARTLVGLSASLMISRLAQAAGPNEPIDPKVVSIGCSLSLTGPVASRSAELRQGLEAGVLQANAKGINGRELRLVALDDGYVASRAADNARKLIGDSNTAALIACTGTANNQSILPLVDQAQIPYIAPQSGAISLRKADYRSVFHVRASYADEARQLAQRLASMGLTDLAVIYQDNIFGREILNNVQAALKTNEGNPALRTIALPESGGGLDAAIAQATSPRPQAIILGTAGDLTMDLITGLRKVSRRMPLVTTSVALSGSNIRQLGEQSAGLALAMVMPDANHTSVALTRDYQKAMRAAGYNEFSAISYEGYVNVRVLTEGLERAGKDLTRARLRTAMAGIRAFDMGGLTVDYSGGAPYVGSRFIQLGVLGANGRVVG